MAVHGKTGTRKTNRSGKTTRKPKTRPGVRNKTGPHNKNGSGKQRRRAKQTLAIKTSPRATAGPAPALHNPPPRWGGRRPAGRAGTAAAAEPRPARGGRAAGGCAAGPRERTRVWKQRGHTSSAAAPAKRLAHRGVGCRRGPQNAPGNKAGGGAGTGIARRGRCDPCAWPPSLGPVSARASFCPLDLELLRLHSTPRRFPRCCR